jgi:hypothetical protein
VDLRVGAHDPLLGATLFLERRVMAGASAAGQRCERLSDHGRVGSRIPGQVRAAGAQRDARCAERADAAAVAATRTGEGILASLLLRLSLRDEGGDDTSAAGVLSGGGGRPHRKHNGHYSWEILSPDKRGLNVVCSGETSLGEYTSDHTLGKVSLKLSLCESALGKCTSPSGKLRGNKFALKLKPAAEGKENEEVLEMKAAS